MQDHSANFILGSQVDCGHSPDTLPIKNYVLGGDPVPRPRNKNKIVHDV